MPGRRRRGGDIKSRGGRSLGPGKLAPPLDEILRGSGPNPLQRLADELAGALGCAVIITRRPRRDGAVIEGESRSKDAGAPYRPAFVREAADRLAVRTRALTLSLDDSGSAHSAQGQHYLGLPAPRRIGAEYALHFLRRTPFSQPEKQLARFAADALGEWATRGAKHRETPAERRQQSAPSPAIADAGVAIEQLLSDAMRAAAETLGADTCSIMVMDEAKDALVVDTAYGLAEGIVHDPERRPGEGIASYVMSLGRPVILGDLARDPQLRGLAVEPRPDIKCSICVPIGPREGLRGVVSFNRTENSDPFTQDDLQLARTVAMQLGPCVANARLYQEAAEQLGDLTAITRMADAVTPAMGIRRVAELLAPGIAEAAGIQRCRVYLGSAGSLALVVEHGYPADGSAAADAPAEQDAVSQAAAEGRVVVAESTGQGNERGADGPGRQRFCVAAPIMGRGRTLGVFSVGCEDAAALNALNLERLEKALLRAGLALDNASTHERLRENLDDLYRLYNSVQRINASFEPEEILERTAHEVKLLGGCRRAGFVPLSPELFDLPRRSGSGWTMLRLELDGRAMGAAQSMTGALSLSEAAQDVPGEMDDLAAEILRLTGSARALVIPVAYEQGNLGLVVGWNFSRAVREREIASAAGVCAHGAALLRKALDYQAAINKRSLELSALYQLCEEISTATSFESALRSVLEIAHSMVDYDEGLIFIRSGDSGRLEVAACRGVDPKTLRQQAPQAQPGNMYQWVFAEGKAFISTDIGQHSGDAGPAGQALRSAMAVPLVVGNEAIGVLAIHSARSRAYTEEHVKVLSIVASQAAAIYRALQSLGRLSRYTDNILQSIVAGVIGLDPAGRVVIWSPAAEAIFDLGAEAAVGSDFLGLARAIGGEQAGIARRSLESLALVARRVLADGEPALEHELRFERHGAPPKALLAGCTPLRDADGELVGAVLLVEDITERKRMDDRLRQMSQLAAVGHLAANVAHEIRNPLSAIKTAAQFLSTEYASDRLIAEFSGIINEECDRLGKVATDFLTYARPNEPALERVSLVPVVEGALAATVAEMAERGIEVDWHAPKALPKVWADADAIRQVFVNLLINAAQAIGRDGRITVEVHASNGGHDGRVIEVAISDTGPGIPDEIMERIWTPFFSTKTKGTGLGLSIVRKAVESHGGQVWAQSARQGGASFRIRLPVDRAVVERRAFASALPSPATPPRWRQLELFDEDSPRSSVHPAAAAEHQGAHG
jgi:PAS domain S-box-containing protein